MRFTKLKFNLKMIDDNENMESGLNLLESLDLGHRRIYSEESKQKENKDFLENINLLLSKFNERIEALKNIPKLEIKSFDIESINSNLNTNNNIINNNNVKNNRNSINNHKSENQINNPYSNYHSKNNENSNSNNLIKINNGINISETPNLPEDNNMKFIIPDSTNENLNNADNNLNNNIIVSPKLSLNLESNSNKENSQDKENHSNNIIINNNNNNINENEKNGKESINNKSGISLKKSENEKENENNNNNQENNVRKKNINTNEQDNDVIEINENNLDELVSIPEMTDNNEKPKEINHKDEKRESQNDISQHLNNKDKNEEENKQFEIKNSELVFEEIEVFEPNNQLNPKELNNLKHTNNNENKNENESQEKVEIESENPKKENGGNEINMSKEHNKEEDKKLTEEDDYNKEFNKINTELKRQNTISSNNEGIQNNNSKNNINPEENDEENKSENNNNKIKEKENKKNDLKKNIIKKDDDSDGIQSLEILSSKVDEPMEEKNKNIDEIKKEEDKKKEIKKEEEKNESIKKEKNDKDEEDEIEIKTENSVEIQDEKKEQEETKNHNNKNNNKKNTVNNNVLKNIKEVEEEDILSPSSKIKQSTLTKLNKVNTIPQINEFPPQNIIKKTLTEKGDILIQIRSTYTRTEKDESFPDISNIDEYPVLTNLNEEEKSLDQLIPEFNEKILKNEKGDIDVRKNSLIKKKFIPLKIDEGQNYSTYFGDLPESHPELMQMNYNEENLKSKIQRDAEFEEKIFNKLPFDEINSPIGIIESFDTFCQKYTLTKEDIKNTLSSSFSKWRKILGDGNSLYRVIMFSIIEAYILSKNIPQLKFLIYDIISQDLNIYENQKVDMEICAMIFAEILYLLEQDNNSKAYEIFVKSFSLKDGSFDKLLIIYIRHILSIYSANVKEILPNEEKNNIANTNIFNSYMIEYNNIEPSFLNLCSIQYLFDIKINMVYLHGGLDAPEQRGINLVGEEDDSPIINIGFFYSSYHKLYPQNFEITYNYELPLQKTMLRQLTFIMKDTRKCEDCKKETEHILFLDKKYIICKSCLEKILTKICNFRSDSFMRNGFLGIEYYTRPINLQGPYYIDDYEIIELLESNILETLIQKYSGVLCDNCHKKEENTIELNCGCEFCKKCLTEILLKKTKGKRVLIEFEKKQFKNIKCSCGKPFDIEQSLKFISKNSNDKEEALNRLRKYINTLCLICTKELRKEGNKKNEYKDLDESISYKRVKMKKMNTQGEEGEIYESEHLLCDECYKKFMGRKIELNDIDEDEEDKPKNNYVDFEKEIISCSICCRKHLFKITQNENCCAGGCVIY